MPPMMTRIMVITGTSLTKLSLVQRIRLNTMRRPMVRLSARNSAVPSTLRASVAMSTVPCSARPNVMAMMIHPIESSMMAEATMTCPTVRRMKFISRTTMATILMEEIDSAVPRNSDVISRWSGLGSMASGRNSPSANPHRNGSEMPASDTLAAAAPTFLTRRRSICIPVSSSNIRMPSWETPSIMLFCAPLAGKIACCASGQIMPNTEGPSTMPPRS